MYLIVGLGNPGKEYTKTRHNVGFLTLDAFAKEHGFPEFTLSKKHSSLVSEGFLGSTKVLLAKPQTFMNNSGKAVKSLTKNYKLKTTNLLVVHDDIDISFGEVKVSKNRGSAGHKGVESIIQTLGTKNFTRIRIGIQPQKGKPGDVETFVLKKFTKAELPLLHSALQQASSSLSSIAG
ncbi:MAG: aminoacyl-tRNA hydrolase [bacterium]|nr:aminoacyl-tRNA hydrolase [bacterium]